MQTDQYSSFSVRWKGERERERENEKKSRNPINGLQFWKNKTVTRIEKNNEKFVVVFMKYWKV